MKNRWYLPLILLPVLAASLLAGCGGSDEDPPTKAAFIKQADAICLGTDGKQEEALEAENKKTPLEQLSQAEFKKVIVKVGFPPLDEEVEELEELTAPEGDEEEFSELVGDVEEAVEKAKADPESLSETSTSPFRSVDERGKDYGFKECSDFS